MDTPMKDTIMAMVSPMLPRFTAANMPSGSPISTATSILHAASFNVAGHAAATISITGLLFR